MQFFLPGANDPEQARSQYSRIRSSIEERHGALHNTCIYRVAFPYEGRQLTLAVGDSLHMLGGEPVLAILEGQDIYVCTRGHGVVEGEPFVVPRDSKVNIEVFR